MEIDKPIEFKSSDKVLADETLAMLMTVLALVRREPSGPHSIELEYLRSKALVKDYRQSQG